MQMPRFRAILLAASSAALLAACATGPAAPETAGPGVGEPARAGVGGAAVSGTSGAGGLSPAEVASPVFDLPRQERELANGLKVIVVKTDFPDIVSLQIPVQTGSRNEVEPGKTGFAHFFEHMMFRGTENTSAEEFNAALKRAGANINAYTTDDYTNYHIDFTKADLETILALEADRFMNLSYGEDVFRTEALAVKGEYIKNSANPIRKLFEQVRAVHYKDHTYRHTTMGFFEDILEMPEQYEYSKIFFDRWYRPENAAVILVGDLEFEETFALVEKHFGPWQRGSYEAQIPVEPPGAGPTSVYIPVEAPAQPWIGIAFRGPAFDPTAPDTAAIRVLAQHYFSDNSELYRKLVLDRQVVDQMFSFMPMNRDPGLFWVLARITDPTAAADVRDEILATFARARTETLSPKKLAPIKARMRYGFLAGLDNSVDIAGELASVVQYERTVDTVNQLYNSYAALAPADLTAAANRYFTDAVRTIGVVAPGDSLAGVESGGPLVDDLVAAAGADGEAAFELVERRSEASPLVDVSWVFRAGAAFDPPGKKGLAQLTALMLTEAGSADRPIDQINDALYPMAAGFGAQVGKEMVQLGGTVHRDNLDAWYALVTEQLLTPGWREEDFTRLKTQLVNAIVTDLVANNDEELGKEALYQFIYGADHPYGTLTLGLVEDVQALTLDDVKSFYAAHYSPTNLTVGLAGGYPTDFVTRLRSDLAALPEAAGARTVALPPPPAIDGHEALILEKATMAHAVSFGFPIELKRGDPDWVALWLATQWLGQHRSQNAHLYERIREKRGMNYGDYAYIEYFPRGMYLTQPEPNLFRQQQIFQVWLRPLTGNNEAHFATRVALYELDKLIDDGLSEAQFAATREFLQKWVAQLVSSQPALLGYAIDSDWYEIPDFTDYVRGELARLTVEDVNRAIREHLSTTDIKFVFITPDAADLRQRLLDNTPSPMTYNSPKPEALLAEDAVIEVLPLDFSADDIRVQPAEAVFRR